MKRALLGCVGIAAAVLACVGDDDGDDQACKDAQAVQEDTLENAAADGISVSPTRPDFALIRAP
jgi:hypothetical protein